MTFVVIIPARFFSTRFPGKPLAHIQGKPMIVRVMEKALMSNAEKVIVATDHSDIVKAIEIENTSVEVVLTKCDHQSGIERLEEVVNRYSFSNDQIIVNLQGDEPLISPYMINLVANDLLSFVDSSMSTLAIRMYSLDEIYNPNVVKVVVDMKSNALYFSRSVIPWYNRDVLVNSKSCLNKIFLRHIGIYSYYASFIHRYIGWEPSPLEKSESLEQLRVLWHGEKIHVSIIDDNMDYVNIDTPEELVKVNLFFRRVRCKK